MFSGKQKSKVGGKSGRDMPHSYGKQRREIVSEQPALLPGSKRTLVSHNVVELVEYALTLLSSKEADLRTRHHGAKVPRLLRRNAMRLLQVGKKLRFRLELKSIRRAEERRAKHRELSRKHA
jgi:hypothetical protein